MSDGDVVYSYIADSTGIMEAIDEVSAGIQSLIEDINGLVEASSALGEFEGIFEEIAAIFGGVDEAAGEAASGVGALAEEAGVAADALGSLGADSESFVEIGASAEEAASGIGVIAEEAGIASDALGSLGADGESLVAIGTSADEVASSIGVVAEEAGIAAEALSALGADGESFAEIAVAADEAASGIGAVAEEAGIAADAVAALGTGSETLASVGENANEAASQVDEIGISAVQMSDVLVSAIDVAQAKLVLLQSKVQDATEALAEMQAEAAASGDFSGIDEATAQLVLLQAKAQEAAAALAELTAAESEANVAAEGMNESLESGGNALQSAQGSLMMISMAAIAGGAAFLDMGRKGQDGIALVQGMAGASAKDIQNLENEAMRLGVTMDEASAGLYQIASAGYSGSQGLEVLDNSVKAAKASGSEMSDVASALTGVLHAYNLSADDSGKITDQMVQTVVQGKQSFADFASAIGPLAATAANLGIKFDEVTAAEATMTQINPHVKQDANQLQHLMTALAADTGKMAITAGKLGISFDEAHYKTLNFQGKLQYLKDQCGDNQTAFTKLVGGTSGLAAALDLLSGKGAVYEGNLKAIANSQGATDKAFERSEQTITAHMEKASAAMSVFATKVVEALGPKINPVIDQATAAIGNFADLVVNHTNDVMPILAGLAAMIGGAVVGAIGAMVIAMWPVIAVLGAIGVVVAGVVYAWQHWGDIMKQVNAAMDNPVIKNILKICQDIGAFLAATFNPVWQELVAMWQTQLVPAFQGFDAVAEPVKNILIGIAILVGALLAGALATLTGLIKGVVQAIAALIAGLIQAFGGIIQGMMGFVKIISGLIAFLYDLFTGNWKKLGADLGMIWDGITTMARGFGNVLMGIFGGFLLAIGGFFSGFVTGVIDFFRHLFDVLVGHSIVPDMVNAIINWFERLPAKALEWGGDMVKNFADGINGFVGQIGQACANVANTIASWLHFSKPDIGPLATSDEWMKDFGDQLSDGLDAQQPKIKASSNNVATAISGSDLSKLGDTAKQIVKSFGDIAKEIDKVFGPINKSLGDLDKLGNHLDGMAKSSQKTVDAFNKLGNAIKDSTKPVNEAGHVFDGLKGLLDKAFNAISDSAPKFKKLEPMFKDIQKPIQDASKDLKAVGDAIEKAMKPVNDALNHLDNFEKSTAKIAKNAQDLTKAFKDLGPAISDSSKKADDSQKNFTNLGPALDKVKKAIDDSLPDFKKIAPALKDAEKPIGDAVGNYKKISDAINNAFKPVNNAINDIKKLNDSIGKMADGATKMVKGFNDMGPAISTSHTEATASIKPYGDLQAAVNRVATEINNQLPKFRTLEQIMRDGEAPLKKATDNFDKITDSLRKSFDPINKAIDNFKKFPDTINETHKPLTQMSNDFTNLETKITESCGETLQIISNFGKTFEKQFDDLKSGIDARSKDIARVASDALGSTLASNGYTWGKHFMEQFIAGIRSQQGNLNAAVGAAANTISSQLHHTTPEEGPLADDDRWGIDFVDNFIKGIESRIPDLSASVAGIAASLAAINPSTLPQGPGTTSGGSNDQVVAVLRQILSSQQQTQRQLLSAPTSANLGAVTQNFGNVSFNGVNDPQTIAQQFERLLGEQYTYGLRGTSFNY